MDDLTVVGAGFWGTAVAIKARAAGLKVSVVDSREPGAASINSDAIVDPAAFKKAEDRLPPGWLERVPASIDWACRQFGATPRPGVFWNWWQKRVPRPTRDLVAVDLGRVTAGDVTPERVTRLSWDGSCWSSGGHRSRYVALCTGAWVDELLVASGLPPVGVTRLSGRGWVIKGIPLISLPPGHLISLSPGQVLEIMLAPYVKLMVRGWPGGLWQVGSTAERGVPNANVRHLGHLRQASNLTFLPGWEVVREMWGHRPVTPQCVVREVAPGLVVATGGHRMGLGLAGLVGDEVLKIMRFSK